MRPLRSYEATKVRAFMRTLGKLEMVGGNETYRFSNSLIYVFTALRY
jgi:hypothetical protein